MRHVKLFKSFLDDEKMKVMLKIFPVVNDTWFIEGEDSPEKFIQEFEGMDVKDENLQTMIDVSTLGPGLIDVWIEANELIQDVLDDPDAEYTEEEIEDSNRKWFASERAKIKSYILSTISPEEINKRLGKSPEETLVWLKGVWKSPDFSQIRKELKVPENMKKDLETLSDLHGIGF